MKFDFYLGINATCFSARPSGAKNRFIGFFSYIFKKLDNIHFTVYMSADYDLRTDFVTYQNVTFISTPLLSENSAQRFFVGLFYWRKELKKNSFHIFESFHLPLITNPFGKTLLTIHDIRHLRNRSAFQTIKYLIHKHAVSKSDFVITVSETMKHEIKQIFPNTKISVIYNGQNYLNNSQDENFDYRCLNKHNITQPFIMAVGHFEARKNYLNLLKAIKLYHKKYSIKLSLVMIGNDNGHLSKIKSEIHELDLNENIRILSGIGDQELFSLYSSAQLFIFPSTYEGFGIPILESFNAMCPIITSNIEVFKEITEGELIYFDPYSIEDIVKKMHKVLNSDSISERIVNYGKKRKNDFEYKFLVNKYINIYHDLLGYKNETPTSKLK